MYRNLRVFAFSFALEDHAFAVFWVTDFLAGTKSFFAFGLFYLDFGDAEFLAARGEELGDVVDGVVVFAGILWRSGNRLFDLGLPTRALVFVFVGVVCFLLCSYLGPT